MNVVVRPKVHADYRRVLHTATLLTVEGMVQTRGGVVNLLAWRAAAMNQPSPRQGWDQM
jgi:hypothetical protein